MVSCSRVMCRHINTALYRNTDTGGLKQVGKTWCKNTKRVMLSSNDGRSTRAHIAMFQDKLEYDVLLGSCENFGSVDETKGKTRKRRRHYAHHLFGVAGSFLTLSNLLHQAFHVPEPQETVHERLRIESFLFATKNAIRTLIARYEHF